MYWSHRKSNYRRLSERLWISWRLCVDTCITVGIARDIVRVFTLYVLLLNFGRKTRTTLGKRNLGGRDNIKVGLREIWCEVVYWSHRRSNYGRSSERLWISCCIKVRPFHTRMEHVEFTVDRVTLAEIVFLPTFVCVQAFSFSPTVSAGNITTRRMLIFSRGMRKSDATPYHVLSS